MTAALAKPRTRHWLLALGAALLLHAALAVVFHQLVDGGATASGLDGIEVGLAPAGGTQGSPESEVAPEEVGGAEVAEAVAAEAPPPKAAEVPPETIAEAVPVSEVPLYAPEETVEAEAPPLEEAVTEPAPSEAAEAEEAEPAEEVLAESVMAPPPPPKAKPQRQPEAPQPEVAEAAEESPQEEDTAAAADATATVAAPQEGAPAVSDQIGNNGKSGIGDRAAVGTSEGHSGGGVAGAYVDYKSLLYAWLEKHKEYPRRARLRRQEGTAILHFVIDRAGRVLEYRIERSSGYKLLDTEVAAMIERASPLPEVPDEGSEERFVFVIPVTFNLR